MKFGFVILYVLAFAAHDLVAGVCPTFRPTRPGEAPAGSEIGFVVEDVAAAFSAAVAAGASAFAEPVTKPWGQIVSYARDLNGYLVELCSAVSA